MKYLLLIIATLSNIDWIFLDEQRQITIWVYQIQEDKSVTELKFQGPFTVMPYQPCVLLKVDYINNYPSPSIYYRNRPMYGSNKKEFEKMMEKIGNIWNRYKSINIYVPIVRETCGRESLMFRSFFQASSSNVPEPMPRLYRLTYYNEQFHILQVPLSFTELNPEDVFLLESSSLINYIFSVRMLHRSNFEENIRIRNKLVSAAFRLSSFINENKMAGKTTFLVNKSYLDNNSTKFFELFPNKPRNIDIFNNLRSMRQREPLELSELYIITNEKAYLYRALLDSYKHHSSAIKSQECYVLVKEKVLEVMVYVGDAASSNDLTYALQYGELQMKDYWTFSVVQNTDLSAAFVTVFKNVNDVFFKETEEMEIIQSNF